MKPRLLLIAFSRLMPAEQGNARRIMQLVSLYERQGFEIDLLYHQEEGHDLSLSRALAARFARVAVISSQAPKSIEQPDHICRVAAWYDRQLDAAVRDLHQLRGYRLVHANYVWYAPVFEQFGSDVVKVLDAHDVFADRAAKYRQSGMAPQWFSTTQAEEDQAFRRADAVLAIQKEEAAQMAGRGHRNILYLPYVEPQLLAFDAPRTARPLTLGYLGSANDWNVRSLNQFLDAVRRRGGRFVHPVLVAGAITRHIAETPGVVKLGFVKELGNFYKAIDIAINPMVGGTGLKIKTVEPLCYGTPVLSTSAGAQGLGHLWELPIFDSAEAMVAFLETATPDSLAPAAQQLFLQAQRSRAALDLEYDAQVERFSRWLLSKT